MKQSAVDYLTSMDSMLPNPIVFDENKPIQSTLDYMKNNPTLFSPSDLIVQNLRREILAFKKFRIDSIQ